MVRKWSREQRWKHNRSPSGTETNSYFGFDYWILPRFKDYISVYHRSTSRGPLRWIRHYSSQLILLKPSNLFDKVGLTCVISSMCEWGETPYHLLQMSGGRGKCFECHRGADVWRGRFGGGEGEISHQKVWHEVSALNQVLWLRLRCGFFSPCYISIRCEWLLYGSASPTVKSFISNSPRESSCTGLGRGSKLRRADLPSNVLLCLLSSCYLNRSTITNRLLGIRDGSMMLSHRNLVYLTLQTFPSHAAAPLPPDRFSYAVIAM